MTDKERYEQAMRQDYPRDFLDDDFLDAIEDCAHHKPKQTNYGVPYAEKRQGGKNMADNATEKRTFSNAEKCEYYGKRVNDPTLSQRQREHAQKRLSALCGKKSSAPAKTSTRSATAGQRAAYGAGVAYGAAKAGAIVPVKPENRESFRNGIKRGKTMGKIPLTGY